MARHYLDHASTSPARPEVVEAVTEWMGHTGDPGRLHAEGLEVRAAVEAARDAVAVLVGATNREVVFTSGATEAVVTAVWGATQRHAERAGAHGPVVMSAVEHSCVREAAERSPRGVVDVAVDDVGRVDLDALDQALAAPLRPSLVCVQWANHEVGTVQPVAEVAQRCRAADVVLLVDAATAVGHVPVDVTGLGIDLLACSAHKLGGPPGIGALVVRRGLRLPALMVGGAQERARRAGLENVPAILGFGTAADVLTTGGTLEREAERARALTDRVHALADGLDGMTVFGDRVGRVPQIACVGIDDIEAEPVLVGLDRRGVAVHSGSACSSELLEPSPVLAAMGAPADRSLRVSVGWSSTTADVEALEAALPRVLAELRALRPA